ncbi:MULTISPECIES: hypothetical protein [unclassified Streptomyces]|uniref:hypothetical protein n=1 Tax=unclassified Streptomyces TaxID=2593676 RepID=UPI002E1E426A|nr:MULTISPECIES: hypothetical protein [unclassified Streptomyces]WSV02074.1 hypothetical protein OG217_38280 [Streptomyces sp. NBC_01023]WSX47275.1 hypothetical protein OG760_36725 [Streptomyces sp. NBC_00963]
MKPFQTDDADKARRGASGCVVIMFASVIAIVAMGVANWLWHIPLLTLTVGLAALVGSYRLGGRLRPFIARHMPDPYPEDNKDDDQA